MDPQMQSGSGVRTWQWVVTVIVIIVLIIIGIFVFGGKKAEAPATAEETPATQTQSGNAIIMSDQFPGNVVYISSVQSSQPVWVAIHKDNAGAPGEIIGYARFDAGINPGRITLTKPTMDGGTYYAMLHADDGDSTFDPVKDAPLKDSSGRVIMRVFRATVSATSEIKG